MDNQTSNPLAGYFRQAVIYTKLLSGGNYWPDGAINIPANGELPVLPMTTKDEITLRTPDALLNGSGVVNVIQSCFPSILDAWKCPSIDVDTLLIALRIASYGSNLDVEAVCPHCKSESTYGIDLNIVLANLKAPDYSKTLTVNNLTLKFKPQSYASLNQTNMTKFEEQRMLELITSGELSDEEKSARFTEHLERIVDLNMQIITDSIEHIQLPDGDIVTNAAFIKEFFNNTDRHTIASAKAWLEEASTVAAIKPIEVACQNEECQKNFNVALAFDYAHFFE